MVNKNNRENLLKINLLLDDDELFQEYIKKIDYEEFITPKDLSKNILKNIRLDENKNARRNNINIFSVLKIAACTIFAIIIWYKMPQEYNMPNMKVPELNLDIRESTKVKIDDKINCFGEKVTNFFMLPDMNFERGNNK